MKTIRTLPASALAIAAALFTHATPAIGDGFDVPAKASAPIAAGQLGAAVEKQYTGEGLAVTASRDGALLRCVFQKMEGEVTREGLWLTSTTEDAKDEKFRVMATAVGRDAQQPVAAMLPRAGTVEVADKVARFLRPGLVEEYSVSVDGVRQDFIIGQQPAGSGQLRVELEVTGAAVEPLVDGARLVLAGSGRKLNYNRLRVTDANGKELTARMEVDGDALSRVPTLAILVDDADAAYPIRIDPTFTDANWISIGGIPAGANSAVNAVVVDGSGNVFIGGYFTVVGNAVMNRIAQWNGSSWSTLGSGMNNTVFALAVSGSDLYAGGEFTTAGGVSANRIAKWNGSSWSALGSGMNSTVYSLVVSGSDLYVGGQFSTAGGVSASGVAKWNGSSWSGFGSGINTGPVYALAVSGSDVYAGGQFTEAGGSPAINIAKWNGSIWSALGSGVVGYKVSALAVSGSDVYAGGSFYSSGGAPGDNIAKWDGSSWSALGTGIGNYVNAVVVSGSDVYVGGAFYNAGETSAQNIAKWDGNTWSTVGSGMNSDVIGLAVSGSDLHAVGIFTTAGEVSAQYIAKWDGNIWSATGSGGSGSGMNGSVQAVAVLGSDVYAAGDFSTAGGVSASKIAKWNGSSWSALGSGVDSTAYSLMVSGSDLYVGGQFSSAGGMSANGVAKWDGSSWSGFGSGITGGRVQAMAFLGSDLYAAGTFFMDMTPDPNIFGIAKWNGSSWSPVGGGVGSDALALAVLGTNLYVGGYFSTVFNTGGGAVSVNQIAKWDGTSWSALGPEFGGTMRALAVSGSDLYAGGDNGISKWNGTSWSALGSGIGNTVQALAVSGSDVYAGGQFYDGGRGLGQSDCQMGWEQLERARLGVGRQCDCAGGVGQRRRVCGRLFHGSRRQGVRLRGEGRNPD